jgi:hypothetical protein
MTATALVCSNRSIGGSGAAPLRCHSQLWVGRRANRAPQARSVDQRIFHRRPFAFVSRVFATETTPGQHSNNKLGDDFPASAAPPIDTESAMSEVEFDRILDACERLLHPRQTF